MELEVWRQQWGTTVTPSTASQPGDNCTPGLGTYWGWGGPKMRRIKGLKSVPKIMGALGATPETSGAPLQHRRHGPVHRQLQPAIDGMAVIQPSEQPPHLPRQVEQLDADGFDKLARSFWNIWLDHLHRASITTGTDKKKKFPR